MGVARDSLGQQQGHCSSKVVGSACQCVTAGASSGSVHVQKQNNQIVCGQAYRRKNKSSEVATSSKKEEEKTVVSGQ